MGEERSDEGKNSSVLKKKEFVFPQSTLCLSWVFPLSVLTSQAPVLSRAKVNMLRLSLQKEKFLFTGNSKRKIVKVVYTIIVAEMWNKVLLFPFCPALWDLPGNVAGLLPGLPTGVQGSPRAGRSEVTGVSWSSLTAGLALQQSFMEWKRESLILNVFTKNEREEGEGSLYKTKQKPLESSQKLHTF